MKTEDTLLAFALEFEVSEDELTLALTSMELARGTSIHRRAVRHGNRFETYYLREEVEAALAREGAKILGASD